MKPNPLSLTSLLIVPFIVAIVVSPVVSNAATVELILTYNVPSN
jgi:hypothetical protein